MGNLIISSIPLRGHKVALTETRYKIRTIYFLRIKIVIQFIIYSADKETNSKEYKKVSQKHYSLAVL